MHCDQHAWLPTHSTCWEGLNGGWREVETPRLKFSAEILAKGVTGWYLVPEKPQSTCQIREKKDFLLLNHQPAFLKVTSYAKQMLPTCKVRPTPMNMMYDWSLKFHLNIKINRKVSLKWGEDRGNSIDASGISRQAEHIFSNMGMSMG